MILTALILFAYLLGSISAAILVCKLMRLPDPRTVGSNNPGATNVLRFGGKKAAAWTLIIDMLKGLLPVLVAHALQQPATVIFLVALAAFFGHLYPLFFGFRGGKGVATALGAMFGIHLLLGVGVGLTWLIVAKGFRISSVSALIATALSPLFTWLLGYSLTEIGLITLLTIVLWWRHRSNIRDLLQGRENPIKNTPQSTTEEQAE